MRIKRGFVLIEVLLAVAIAAFAVCGILFLYVTAMELIRTSKNASIATSAAEGLMERIRSSSNFETISLPVASGGYKDMLFTVNGIPNSMGRVYVNDTDPEFLLITISVCWRQGTRVIGEDTNLSGELEAGEDVNNNLIIDSPVQLITQFANPYQQV